MESPVFIGQSPDVTDPLAEVIRTLGGSFVFDSSDPAQLVSVHAAWVHVRGLRV